MNDSYRDLGGGVFDDSRPEPVDADPVCPSCQKVTSVTRIDPHWLCTDCNLAFTAGDHERVQPEWAKRYRKSRTTGYPDPLPPQRYEHQRAGGDKEAPTT